MNVYFFFLVLFEIVFTLKLILLSLLYLSCIWVLWILLFSLKIILKIVFKRKNKLVGLIRDFFFFKFENVVEISMCSFFCKLNILFVKKNFL